MKFILLIFTALLFFSLFTNCFEQNIDKQVYNTSNKLIRELDSNTIQPFKDWSCVSEDKTVRWTRLKNKDSYWLTYQKIKDTNVLGIEKPGFFQNDFKTIFIFDTMNNRNFKFYFQGDAIFRISFINSNGVQNFIDTFIKLKDIFPFSNPFNTLDSLTKLKEDLRILNSSYYGKFGNFIEFMPDPYHKLFYLPNDLKFYSKTLNGIDSSIWAKSFSNAERLNKNWVLTHFKDSKCKK